MKDEDQVKALAGVMGWSPDQSEVPMIGAGWNPLTNIADCWQLVEKAAATDRCPDIEFRCNHWHATMHWLDEHGLFLEEVHASSKEPCRAICEAALKAHGKWVEE